MKLTYSEMYLAQNFAKKIVRNIDGKDFMDGRNQQRSSDKVWEDNLKGKVAEIAVANYIYEATGFKSELDFEIYDLGIGDAFDVVVGSVSIDVKASSPRAKTIMVEERKRLSWNRGGCPDYLCMVAVEDDSAKYLFGIPFSEFEEKAKLYKRGENIPNTNFPLKADNYIITKVDCYDHLNLAKHIKENA